MAMPASAKMRRVSTAARACAAASLNAASSFETAFRRLVMILQRDQQALDRAQRQPAS